MKTTMSNELSTESQQGVLWSEFKYKKNDKEKNEKKYDKTKYYSRPVNLEYSMPDEMDKIDKRDLENFIEEHKYILENMYEIVHSINPEIEINYFYKWSYLKTNLDYSIKEILKYNKKVFSYKNKDE